MEANGTRAVRFFSRALCLARVACGRDLDDVLAIPIHIFNSQVAM